MRDLHSFSSYLYITIYRWFYYTRSGFFILLYILLLSLFIFLYILSICLFILDVHRSFIVPSSATFSLPSDITSSTACSSRWLRSLPRTNELYNITSDCVNRPRFTAVLMQLISLSARELTADSSGSSSRAVEPFDFHFIVKTEVLIFLLSRAQQTPTRDDLYRATTAQPVPSKSAADFSGNIYSTYSPSCITVRMSVSFSWRCRPCGVSARPCPIDSRYYILGSERLDDLSSKFFGASGVTRLPLNSYCASSYCLLYVSFIFQAFIYFFFSFNQSSTSFTHSQC